MGAVRTGKTSCLAGALVARVGDAAADVMYSMQHWNTHRGRRSGLWDAESGID